ncbi:5-hydroxyisourate hydrolase [Amycolatopsis xylanica]|uniref:5-hydroxyisourate hydrolase n=1 Tax=Amycolatopsis xylanica TaxID=589385 RepID=A0A1H3R2X3_9PSEU|nr:hydroxyisourate hydrolase [Amycolatopsis xylanica]SDZ19578.1 5-hydroxyisourate hydrolase [Amycolatopsis xylanica]
MSQVTTHVLDTAEGHPAQGVPVRLEAHDLAGWSVLAEGVTDADGRVRDLGPERLDAGVYRLIFDTGSYLGPEAFFPEITVSFRIADPGAHHHVPVLLSPFSYSTYRGS